MSKVIISSKILKAKPKSLPVPGSYQTKILEYLRIPHYDIWPNAWRGADQLAIWVSGEGAVPINTAAIIRQSMKSLLRALREIDLLRQELGSPESYGGDDSLLRGGLKLVIHLIDSRGNTY